jgi:hypothetical protein
LITSITSKILGFLCKLCAGFNGHAEALPYPKTQEKSFQDNYKLPTQ